MLSEKRDVPYSKMISWIHCRMSFSLVRASVMSIRGARSSATKGALHEPIELQAAEGQVTPRFYHVEAISVFFFSLSILSLQAPLYHNFFSLIYTSSHPFKKIFMLKK